MDELTRLDGVSRRTLLKASAVGTSALGLAGCTGADASQDAPAPELDLETSEADTEFGTLQAERAENSYVGPIDDGQAIGIASLDDVGAGDTRDLDDAIVVQLYDRENLAIAIGEVGANGAATLSSVEQSDFDATVKLTMESDAVSGTVTFRGESSDPFTADAAADIAGVYWAHGTDEESDASGGWVVLSDGRQWGCICIPPFTSPCCTLHL
ncbi:twin-arginine translocation signal domain-containing protein [Halosolutus gelatinilyticus]|uniref:twin-arginine translocation signal domain-containing protein n=1 Tax=Halosolutus gelatinilyticus TaxID=2931975 RepID=UPI001FF4F5C8|nr:twin-arginine translocation signal domain-containing protein [Halosolutus gelatinilyticus]